MLQNSLSNEYLDKFVMRMLVSLILILFLNNCSSNGQNDRISYLYKKSKEFFPSHLTNHIPEVYDSRSYFITTIKGILSEDTIMKDFAPHRFMLINKYSDEDFKIEYDKIKKVSLKEFSVNDTNQILIGNSLCLAKYNVFEIDGYNEGDKSMNVIKRNMRNKNGVPLPIFRVEEFLDATSTRLSNNFVLLVLDYHSGKVLKAGSCNKVDVEIVPKVWHNGYSRGYAISIIDKIIIYWVIAW